jgi:hypothetical protein
LSWNLNKYLLVCKLAKMKNIMSLYEDKKNIMGTKKMKNIMSLYKNEKNMMGTNRRKKNRR